MKKSLGKILVILFTTCLLLVVLGATESPSPEYTIDTPYEYPVVPGTQEWIDLGNVFRRRDACQIPEDILHKMTTDALFQTILDYPFLGDIYAFNTYQIGYETVKRRFNGLQEFENRPDYMDVLLGYCQESYSLDENEKSLKDYMAEKMLLVLSDDLDSSFSSYASAQVTTVLTPKGSSVGAIKGRVYGVDASYIHVVTQNEVKEIIENDKLRYTTATLLRGASQPNLAAYNCYSYALHDQSYNNDYWLGFIPEAGLGSWQYFTDGSYIKNTGRPAARQILVYGDVLETDYPELIAVDITHVGIIDSLYRDEINMVVSKWGYGGLWRHHWLDCPYVEEVNYHTHVYEKAT